MIVENIVYYITQGISFGGYFGLFPLMAIESLIAPIPSEIVLPFAGYLVLQGRFNFLTALIASTLGSLFGALISYYIGLYGGRPFIVKFGKYFFIEHEHLEWTEKWFKKNGEKTIFISRFLPIARDVISFPAGIAKMPLLNFVAYTSVGAAIWNFILIYAGFRLGEHWDLIYTYSKELDVIFIIAIAIFLVYFIKKHHHRRKKWKKENMLQP